MQLKTPRGTKDYGPDEMVIREETISQIKRIFQRHGATQIETPVFELRDILMNKYGDDQKLVYDLEDQGGEICSLRYDLTVPFARYMAQNNIKVMKKYQIGKVYRRDEPRMNAGRYREFYQCDFDIAGADYSSMLPDAECITIMASILRELNIGPFMIKINHRKLLDSILTISNIESKDFMTVSSSIDKLDKMSWSNVRQEIITKGISEENVDILGKYVQINGEPRKILTEIMNDPKIDTEAITELTLLLNFLDAFDTKEIVLDLSLARGLTYYTGIIFEAVTLNLNIGSVGGGGRYDKLIGSFKKDHDIPCVGFSIGVERLFTILQKNKVNKLSYTDVMVCSIEKKDENLLQDRMKIVSTLWKHNIAAEIILKDKPNIKSQLRYAESNNIPYAIIIGKSEIDNNIVKIKDLATRQEITCTYENMHLTIATLLKKL